MTLDGVLNAASKRRSLNARKKAALDRQRGHLRQQDDKDDDSLDVVQSPSKPKATGTERQQPDARAIFNRTAVTAAPTRPQQQLLMLSGKRRSKNPVTETHVEYAAQKFGHAGLKRDNAGSRPAGQKPGRDEVIQQAQVNDNLLRRHHHQVTAIAKQKEAKYGGTKQLPPKEPLAAVQLHSTSDSRSDADSESDDDYVDLHSAASSDEHERDLESADEEDGDRTMVGGTSGSPSPQSCDRRSPPSAAGACSDDDAGDDAATPKLRKPRSRALRRVDFESDDEEIIDSRGLTNESVGCEPTVPSQPQPSASINLAGFGSAGGGFSQLFGETQQQETSLPVSALRGRR